jgi:hypothetical protein
MRNIFHIPNHLVFPFGTAQKFDISRIRLSSVGGNGIYLMSDIPCVYIDRSKGEPLTLLNAGAVFRFEQPTPETDDVMGALDCIRDTIKRYMPQATPSQVKFLDLYFDNVKLRSKVPPGRDNKIAYNAMLPIPEMQIYVHDPLDDNWAFEPTNNFRVDFGFWTGSHLVAVEIDGHEPEGYG